MFRIEGIIRYIFYHAAHMLFVCLLFVFFVFFLFLFFFFVCFVLLCFAFCFAFFLCHLYIRLDTGRTKVVFIHKLY